MKQIELHKTLLLASIGILSLALTGLPLIALAGNLTLSTSRTFASLDGSIGEDDDGVVNGVLTVTGNLTLQNGGEITANDPASPSNASASPIMVVVGGDMEMQAGSAIYAENRYGGGSGGNITITVSGNFSLRGTSAPTPGAIISSRKIAGTGGTGVAGNITINVAGYIIAEPESKILADSTMSSAGAITITGGKDATLDGLIQSDSGLSGTGANQGPGGGPITIDVTCLLLVSNNGIIRSRGKDPGADLVHLSGCDVTIYGLVESTGPGHAIPNNPPNHLNSIYRPDKPSNSTAGVEIWATEELLIDALNHNGQVNADIAMSGGTEGIAWIDLFAYKHINIIGKTAGNFAVHANEGATNGGGGIVTVKSLAGDIRAIGLALQADSTGGGGAGGTITVEAGNDVNLDNGTLYARGDYVAMGGYGYGGKISVRSFNGSLSWKNGVGDVRPTGTDVPASRRGTISLTYCTTIDTSGTSFPSNGTPTTPDPPTQTCGGSPTFESYVIFKDCADCICHGKISGLKWNDLNGDGKKDLGEDGLTTWTIELYMLVGTSWQLLDSTITGPGGIYTFFNLVPGVYRIKEVGQPGWMQTYPVLPDYHEVILGECEEVTGKDFGNKECFCVKLPQATVLDPVTGRFPGNKGCDIVVRTNLGQSIQTAIDTVTDINNDGYLIIGVVNSDYCMYGGHVYEDIIISNYYDKPFALIACSVTLHDPTPNDGLPVVYITASAGSPQNIFVMDLHADDSQTAGYIVEGNGRYLRNVFTHKNQIGIKVVGNQNILHNNIAESNTSVGILIQGNNNYVTDTNAMSNGSHGIQVIGNNNTIIKCDAGDKGKGNKGNGVIVSGSGNLLQENDAFANTMNGIEVSGGTTSAPNRLLKNRAGDKGKGNLMHGIMVNGSDAGNGASNPIELEENTTKANKLDGIRVLGSGHQLKKNISGGSGSYPSGEDNGDWEYYLGAGNINAGGNKTNNAIIPLVIPGGTGTP